MRVLKTLVGWSFLVCIPAGALWALSPLGIYLSEYAFKTPNVFWRLFPSAPLLMLIGLVGVYLFCVRDRRLFLRVGFWTAVVGAVLTIAGALGKYYLGLDEAFIMTAPAWTAMRAGFFVLAVGCVVFGGAAARRKTLPFWAAFPFAVTALAGAVSVFRDFGEAGAAMWIAFGVGWSWLGASLFVARLYELLKKRRARKVGSDASKTPATSI